MEQLHGLKQSEVTESREKYGSNVCLKAYTHRADEQSEQMILIKQLLGYELLWERPHAESRKRNRLAHDKSYEQTAADCKAPL